MRSFLLRHRCYGRLSGCNILIRCTPSFAHRTPYKLVKAIPFVLEEVQWVVLHVSVYPAFVDIFLREESCHFLRTGIRFWLLIVAGKVSLPVGVDQVVIQSLEGFNFAIGPFIEVHRLDLRDMDTEAPVLPCANQILTRWII